MVCVQLSQRRNRLVSQKRMQSCYRACSIGGGGRRRRNVVGSASLPVVKKRDLRCVADWSADRRLSGGTNGCEPAARWDPRIAPNATLLIGALNGSGSDLDSTRIAFGIGVFHMPGGRPRYVLPEVMGDDFERHVNARGDSGRSKHAPVFDEMLVVLD